MKNSLFFLLTFCLVFVNPIHAQKGGSLNKATKPITTQPVGKSDDPNRGPEPACSCDKPEFIMDFGGELQLDYTEVNISISDDGRLLASHRFLKQYYIVEKGVTKGPIPEGDPRLKGFGDKFSDAGDKGTWTDNPYITKSGEKYLIAFMGKSYGPYAQISSFAVSGSKEKFAAIVVENVVVNEDAGKKMDEAIKNAKNDQERMELAMKYSRQMQQKMMQGGGPATMTPKVVTNIPGDTFNPMTQASAFNGNIKYDDVVVYSWDKVMDVHGKTLLTLKQEFIGAEQLFINTTNTKYAVYKYGTLTFSDNTTLSELFNPHLLKGADGKIYLAYMYYSPKRNAIMQCKILF